ncbi:MAG: serine hydrolase [bacterium]|nr:serine hydrolase [bacterium]
MMRLKMGLALLGLLVGMLPMLVLGQSTGVVAEAIGSANLRSRPDTTADKLGEILKGTQYPVVGRSEFFPWVLLGDVTTFQPIGWVFNELVVITGDINTVPLSTLDVTNPPPPVPTATNMVQVNGSSIPTATGPAITPLSVTFTPIASPTPNYTVSGTVINEINIRYGPGTDYPVLGRAFAGEIFPISGYHTQFPWVQIIYAGSPNNFGWVLQELLTITGDIYSLPAVTSLQFNLPTLTPTPAVRAASRIVGQPNVPLSPAFAKLGDDLWNYLLSQGFNPATSQFGALYLQDLQTGEAVTFGNDFAFSGTSINKIAVLAEYFNTMDGIPNLSEAVDIANTMICSENVATNRVMGANAGGDNLQGAVNTTNFMRQLGLTRTFLTAPYDTTIGIATSTPVPRAIEFPITDADQVKANPNPSNQMAVDEMGWMLSSIYECAYRESGPLMTNFTGFTPQECRKMIHVMESNTVDGLLKAGVPENIRVAHKHGWVNDTHGNAGIFFTPGGDYVMVVMLFKPEFLSFEAESLPILGELSRMVYNHYNPTQPLNQARPNYIPGVGECNYDATNPLVSEIASPLFLIDNDLSLFHQVAPAPIIPTATPTLTPTPTPTQTPAG